VQLLQDEAVVAADFLQQFDAAALEAEHVAFVQPPVAGLARMGAGAG
jgi:hypothetical protein